MKRVHKRGSKGKSLILYEMNGNARTGSNVGGLAIDWSIIGQSGCKCALAR